MPELSAGLPRMTIVGPGLNLYTWLVTWIFIFRSCKIAKSVAVLMMLNFCTMVLVLFPLSDYNSNGAFCPMPYEENNTCYIAKSVFVAGFDMLLLIVWHVVTYLFYRRIQY